MAIPKLVLINDVAPYTEAHGFTFSFTAAPGATLIPVQFSNTGCVVAEEKAGIALLRPLAYGRLFPIFIDQRTWHTKVCLRKGCRLWKDHAIWRWTNRVIVDSSGENYAEFIFDHDTIMPMPLNDEKRIKGHFDRIATQKEIGGCIIRR